MPAGMGDNIPDHMRCTATSKQTGDRCGQYKKPGKEVCKWHGGNAKGGLDSPLFKTGRYSRYLPQRLLERYHESLEDDHMLEQRDEIALMQAYKQDLIQQGDSGELWSEVVRLRKAYTRAALLPEDTPKQASEKGQKMAEALNELFDAIDRGTHDYRNRAEIRKVTNMTVRLRESERRYLLEQRQMMSIEEVMTLMVAVSDAIKRHVRESEIRNALAGELRRLTNVSSGAVIDEPGDPGHGGQRELEA